VDELEKSPKEKPRLSSNRFDALSFAPVVEGIYKCDTEGSDSG